MLLERWRQNFSEETIGNDSRPRRSPCMYQYTDYSSSTVKHHCHHCQFLAFDSHCLNWRSAMIHLLGQGKTLQNWQRWPIEENLRSSTRTYQIELKWLRWEVHRGHPNLVWSIHGELGRMRFVLSLSLTVFIWPPTSFGSMYSTASSRFDSKALDGVARPYTLLIKMMAVTKRKSRSLIGWTILSSELPKSANSMGHANRMIKENVSTHHTLSWIVSDLLHFSFSVFEIFLRAGGKALPSTYWPGGRTFSIFERVLVWDYVLVYCTNSSGSSDLRNDSMACFVYDRIHI